MCIRCEWANGKEIHEKYHDEEWGVPVHSDRLLFEFLILEGAQAGLSWLTVLRKREEYRKAYDNFDPVKVAGYDENKVAELIGNKGIIRNKLKINSSVSNARKFLAVKEEFGSFDSYIWQFTDGRVIKNAWKTINEIPAKTKVSDKMSKDLVQRGFKFVGSTICYAHMQATGMVNDHLVHCFRYNEVS